MNKEAHYIELIEKHVGEPMTETEKEEFRQLTAEDPLFRDLYKHMEVLIPAIENSARVSLLHDLKELDARLPEVPAKPALSKQKIRRIGWGAAIAACLAGIVVAITVFKSGNSRYNDIYSRYYKPYSSLAIAGNRSANATTTLKEEAFELYNAGDYSNAVKKLEPLDKTRQDVEIQFYLANAYMATGQMTKAEAYFNLVLTQESLFKDQAKWFLALCYLKTGQPDKAREKFKELINYSNNYTKNAKEILNLVN